jgi:hypothetical protein
MAQPTAINPQTGQRMVYDGKAWKPVGASGVMSDTKTEQDALEKMRADARQSQYVARQAQAFGELNRKTGTGGIMGLNLPFGLGGASDIVKPFSQNVAVMESISSEVAPQMRPIGSGASSDKDVAMFRKSFPNVDNTGPANAQIRARLESEAKLKNSQAQFYDAYFARNGTLLGADRAWSQAQAAKPAQPPSKPVSAKASAKTAKQPQPAKSRQPLGEIFR